MTSTILKYWKLGLGAPSLTVFSVVIYLSTEDVVLSLFITFLFALIRSIVCYTNGGIEAALRKKTEATETISKEESKKNEINTCSSCIPSLGDSTVRCPSCGHRNVEEMDPNHGFHDPNKASIINKQYD